MTGNLPTLRHELAAAVRLAVPIVLAQLGVMLMGTVDVMMLGRVSQVALAAGAVGFNVMMALVVFPMGIVQGIDPLVTQDWGAQNHPRLARHFQQGMVLALLLSVPVVLLMWFSRPFLGLLGLEDAVLDDAVVYLRAASPGIPATLVFFALRQTLLAMSIVRPLVVSMVVANLVNVLANWVLVFGHWGFPALGVEGAAYATALSRWVTTLGLALGGFKALWPYCRPLADRLLRAASYATYLRLGVPVGFQISFELWLFAIVALVMGRLGARELAGHQVALNLAALSFMIPLGVAGAATTRVGNAIGRGDMPAARRAAGVCLGLGAAVMSGSAVLFLTFPRFLSRLYTPEAGVIAMAASLLPLAALFQVFDGLQVVSAGVLRGAADTRAAAIVAFVCYWLVGLPLGLYFAFSRDLGARGLWWGLTLSLMSAALLLGGRVVLRFRRDIAAVEA